MPALQRHPGNALLSGGRQTLRARPRVATLLRAPRLVVRAASKGGGDFSADDIMAKYGLGPGGVNTGGGSGSSGVPAKQPAPQPRPAKKGLVTPSAAGNGVFFLLLANVLFFVADHVLHLPFMRALYLNHAHPEWYQWLTHAFCHANWAHLSANLFNLTVFGKLVEETEGGFGVVFTYIVTALGAAAASYLTTPAIYKGAITVSVGASGAIFGLFAVSVLTRLQKFSVKRLLEAAILGQFVVQQVLSEARAQASGGLVLGGLAVSHMAHLGGALAGVLLVLLLRALPDDEGA